MKNSIALILISCFLLCLSACDKEEMSVKKYRLPIIEELPVYTFVIDKDTLGIDIKHITRLRIINSASQMEDILGEKFLAAYPRYAGIDYEKYSVLIGLSGTSDVVLERSNFFVWSEAEEPWHYEWDIHKKIESGSDDVDLFELSGIVVDKLKDDAIVWTCLGVSTT